MSKRVLFLAMLSACGPMEPTFDGSVDSAFDSGSNQVTDAGEFDAGLVDSGTAFIDSGTSMDAGSDAGMMGFDSGIGDSGVQDAGFKDAGIQDAGRIDAGIPDSGSRDAGALDSGIPARMVTICLTGAVDQSSGSNDGFTAICNALALRDAGVIRSGMNSTFATFPSGNADNLVPNVISALDRNGDNQANTLDGPTQLNLVGFSWGGVNAGSLATKLSTDARINQQWLFTRLIILDAYQVGVSSVVAAATVDAAFSFRHSLVPSGDCSSGVLFGPYIGKRLACSAGQSCVDYDYSLAPTTMFNGLRGNQIGHCDVPQASQPYVIDLVTRGMLLTSPPPSVTVTP